ncbi:Patatin-like phospholipase [uncultured archaeon]|nr:Patatin-like phospholipase [uncultured archaeon]
MLERKKVGLALGGGGARGIAHIGVLKALEKHKIPIDFISGTSIGALIGAMYSAQPNAKKLEKEILETKWQDLFDYKIPSDGLIKGMKIEKFLEEKLDKLKFNQLKIPLFVTSYDLEKKQEVIFQKGDVAAAIRASISIPGIFVPAENSGRLLVDGGIVDLIPVEILRKKGAESIIAVNADYIREKKPILGQNSVPSYGKRKIPGIIHTLTKSLQVIEAEASKTELSISRPDLLINLNLEEIPTLDFSNMKKLIRKGELATNRTIKQLKKLTNPNPIKEILEGISSIPLVKGVEKNIGKVAEDIRELAVGKSSPADKS